MARRAPTATASQEAPPSDVAATGAHSDASALAIAHVAPATLTPAPYNPRTIDEASFARLKRGIAEFGIVDPIVARRSDGLVVGGHQRLRAATDLGLATVPVVYLDDLDDDRTAALNVLLNNPAAQGAWDMGALSGLLSELDGHGFDATLTGFDEAALEALLAWTPAGIDDPAPSAPDLTAQWICAVTCTSETHLATLYDRLTAEGYACKLIT